jgi:cardiolipin synthase
MDYLSLLNNDEVNAFILSRDFALEMEGMFVGDLVDSRQIQWNEWKKRPLFHRIRERLVHIFSSWM